jgi:alanyl-tRNA synthetase
MTERLYYTDCYLREFGARVVDRSPDGLAVYLDRTAFYPASGGQPCDTGTLGGVPVTEVVDEEERIAHRLAAPLAEDSVQGSIDWSRRFDHMQQHTGQHLLSAVFAEAFALRTVGFHLGAEVSTIDLDGGPVEPGAIPEAERRANRVVFENRPVAIDFQDASAVEGLHNRFERTGLVRVVTIAGIDRNACGGTHVRATGEIGPVLIRKVEKVRQNLRLEFLCGARAVARARADFEILSRTSQLLSAALDEVPPGVAAQIEGARAGEKARRKLELELAGFEGRELYHATPPGADGFRRVARRQDRGNLDELRALAQSFTAQPKAVFVAALADPPSVLLAASEDSGIDAGRLIKTAVAESGGRGGGNARIAQGSVPDPARLERVLRLIES